MVGQKKVINIDDILIFCLVSCFFLFEQTSYGIYIIATFAAALLILELCKCNFKINLYKKTFWIHILLLSVYSLASCAWAQEPGLSLEKGITLIELAFFYLIIELHINNTEPPKNLLYVLVYSSYVVSAVVIAFGGLGNILSTLRSDIRFENVSFANINGVAILSTISLLIEYSFFLNKERKPSLLAVLNFLIVISSGTRKALIALILGIIVISFFDVNEKSRGPKISRFVKSLFAITVVAVALYFVLQLPMFEMIKNRLDRMLSLFINNGLTIDNSIRSRSIMVQIGIEQFKKTPILGMGIGNPRILTRSYFGFDYNYLHNNYVELLAGGGIIGTVLFYSIHFSCIYRLRKYKESSDQYYKIIVTILIILLFVDYGAVNYYSKSYYFYLIIVYVYSIYLWTISEEPNCD